MICVCWLAVVLCCLLLFVVLVAVAGFASVMVYDLLLMIAIVACCMVSCLLLCVYGSVLRCRVVHCMDGGRLLGWRCRRDAGVGCCV